MSLYLCSEFGESTSLITELLEKDINQKRYHIYFRVVPHVGTWIEIPESQREGFGVSRPSCRDVD